MFLSFYRCQSQIRPPPKMGVINPPLNFKLFFLKKLIPLFAVAENTKRCKTEEDDASQDAGHDDDAHVYFDGGSFHAFKLIVHHLLASSLLAMTGCASIRFSHAGTYLFIRIGDDALFPPAVDNHLACALRSIFTD